MILYLIFIPLTALHTLGANAANSTSGDAYILQVLTTSECVFACGGDNALRFWKFHPSRKYLEFSDILFSKYKRKINCMEVRVALQLSNFYGFKMCTLYSLSSSQANSTNTFLYCGTSSGDILKVKIKDPHVDSINIENIAILGCFGKKQRRKRVEQFSDAVRYVLGRLYRQTGVFGRFSSFEELTSNLILFLFLE